MLNRVHSRLTLAMLSAITLSGCSSIVSGTSEQLTINSNPPQAVCVLEREGLPIGQVTTPGGLNVTRTKHNIQIKCTKDGYEPATAFLKSDVNGATFGNILIGGGIGWAIDSAAGADNNYQEITTVTLVPIKAASQIAAIPTQEPAEASRASDAANQPKSSDGLRNEGAITPAAYQAGPKAIINGGVSRDLSAGGLFKAENKGWLLEVENRGKMNVTLTRVDDRNTYIAKNNKTNCRDVDYDQNKLILSAWCEVRLAKPLTQTTGFGSNSELEVRFKIYGENLKFNFSTTAPIGDAEFSLNYQPTAQEMAAAAQAQAKAAPETQTKVTPEVQAKVTTETQKQTAAEPQEKSATATTEIANRLKVLNGLRDQGLITQSEYADRRRAMLDGI